MMNYPVIFPGPDIKYPWRFPQNDGQGTLSKLTKCVVKQDESGKFLMEFEMPFEEWGISRYLDVDNVIRADIRRMLYGSPFDQFFRIVRVEKVMEDGVTMIRGDAEHISYELNGNPVVSSKSEGVISNIMTVVEDARLNRINKDDGFTFTYVQVAGIVPSRWSYAENNTVRGALLNLCKQFGCEVQWNNLKATIGTCGVDRETISIEYGKNMASFEMSTDVSGTSTEAYVYYRNGTVYHAPEGPYTQGGNNPYAAKRIKLVNGAEHGLTDMDYTDTSLYRDVAAAWFRVNRGWEPEETFRSETTEIDGDLKLYDRVKVSHPALYGSRTARVSSIEYDVLRQRYNRVEIGSLPVDLAKRLARMSKGG